MGTLRAAGNCDQLVPDLMIFPQGLINNLKCLILVDPLVDETLEAILGDINRKIKGVENVCMRYHLPMTTVVTTHRHRIEMSSGGRFRV